MSIKGLGPCPDCRVADRCNKRRASQCKARQDFLIKEGMRPSKSAKRIDWQDSAASIGEA